MPSSQELGTSRPPQSRKQSPMLWILKRSPKNSWRIPGWTSATPLQNASSEELRSSERTASLPEVRLADSVSLSCIHSPQHAKRTASGSGNGSKIFFCASRQLWPDRLVHWSPGRNKVVNELTLIIMKRRMLSGTQTPDGILLLFPPQDFHHAYILDHGVGWALTL